MTYRAALIGCGKIGTGFADDSRIKGVYTHAGAYMAFPKTELVAVCDIDPEKVARCGKKWEIRSLYTDIPCLLREKSPEIVSICTPDFTHADILEMILHAPSVRAVLAEKPLALNVDRAQNLVQLAEKQGVLLAVNYSRRYSRGHHRIKDLIQSGGMGEIQKISGFYTKGIFHNGSHWFDLARWLVGEVKKVHGFNLGLDSVGDPTLDAWLAFDNGSTGFLQGCRSDAFSVFEMDIVGTKGRVRLVDSGHRMEIFHVTESPYYSGYRSLSKSREEDGELDNILLNAVEDLVICLEKSRRPRCSGADGVAALRIASAVMRSAQNGLQINMEKTNE